MKYRNLKKLNREQKVIMREKAYLPQYQFTYVSQYTKVLLLLAVLIVLSILFETSCLAKDFSDTQENDVNTYHYFIAKNDLNRLSFPFKDINVNTVSNALLKISDGNLYVMPKDDEIITLFVTPSDDEDISILLQLEPRAETPARNIIVSLDETTRLQVKTDSLKERYNQNALKMKLDYKESYISNFIKTVWSNTVTKENSSLPSGYKVVTDLDDIVQKYELENLCNEDDNFITKKILKGFIHDDYLSLTIMLDNESNKDLLINCIDSRVVAFSTLNNKVIANGKSGLVVVVLKLPLYEKFN
jgi:hypothetical protein